MAPEIVKLNDREEWLIRGGAEKQSMNPKHCPCAHYQFYHAACGHAAGSACMYRCGASKTPKSGLLSFCKKPAPRANVDVTKAAIAGKCKACRSTGYGSLLCLWLLFLSRILTASFAQRLAWRHPRMQSLAMKLPSRAAPIRLPASSELGAIAAV